jgi:hypothetical protein
LDAKKHTKSKRGEGKAHLSRFFPQFDAIENIWEEIKTH